MAKKTRKTAAERIGVVEDAKPITLADAVDADSIPTSHNTRYAATTEVAAQLGAGKALPWPTKSVHSIEVAIEELNKRYPGSGFYHKKHTSGRLFIARKNAATE